MDSVLISLSLLQPEELIRISIHRLLFADRLTQKKDIQVDVFFIENNMFGIDGGKGSFYLPPSIYRRNTLE